MNKISFGIEGKVAVITGAGGVLCSEMAMQMAAMGAKVAILDLFEDKAKKVADEITADGGDAIAVVCNVLKKETLEAACETILKKYSKIDILINGAGGNKAEATATDELSFFDIPIEALQFVFDLNFMGTVLSTQVFGRVMCDKGEGCIVNISSMASMQPLTKVVGYSAAKASINNFTQWMAVYMNQKFSKKIRVNAIAPGFLLTEQNYFLLIDKDTGKSTPRGELILANTPMDRYGKPEELVGAVVYLASEAASFVTGIVLPIDGGFSAFSGV